MKNAHKLESSNYSDWSTPETLKFGNGFLRMVSEASSLKDMTLFTNHITVIAV
jgi:hypothetical protein